MPLDPITFPESIEETAAVAPFDLDFPIRKRDKRGKLKEERVSFAFRSHAPLGAFADFAREIGRPGSLGRALDYIEAALIDDDERERFREVLHDATTIAPPGLLDALSTRLLEHYSARPTSSPSGSSDGGASGGRRSAGAAGSRASATSRNGTPA